jgi:ribonuclease D
VVDPLAVDPAPLARVLGGPGTAVLHAAGQDLEVLLRACGTVPSALFDTQVAAGFLGFSTPSLATLLDRVPGCRCPRATG